MEFAGERYVPVLRGQINYEHLHRYAASLNFVVGKTVLDLASGEGFGASLLAQAAATVTGVDLDPVSVEHAKHKYYYPNLNFLVGNYESVPLPDASVDVVTSFETIEHQDKREEMMLEIKRVLKPGGILILSSPNRQPYPDEPNYSTPFHIKELDNDELHDLLNRHFKHQRIYGQKLAAGSLVSPSQDSLTDQFKAFTASPDQITERARRLPSPIYLLIICSDSSAIEKQGLNSIDVDCQDDLLKNLETERMEHLKQLQDQLQHSAEARPDTQAQINLQTTEGSEAQARISQMSGELDDARTKLLDYEGQLIKKTDELARARAAYEAQLRQQEVMLAGARAQLSMYEAQLEQQAASLTEAESKLLKKEKVLQWIQTSRSWQVTSSLKRAQQGLYHFRQFNHKVLCKLHLSGQDDFQGAIDSPDKASRIYRYLNVSGWVFSNTSPVVRVEAFLDNLSLGEVQYGQARPDVVAAYRSQATADCGYTGRFPVDEFLTGHRTLMIRAWDAQGNSKNFVRTIFVDVPDKQPVFDTSRPAIPEKAVGASEKIDSPAPRDYLSGSKKFLTSIARISLDGFLNSNATIEIPQHEKPEISIILVLYNRAELTLQCLYSILRSNAGSFEIIIVDNASTDETRLLLKRIKGARIIENETNVHYLRGSNQAVREAGGEYLLLLNNDTQILADSISSALETIKSSPDIGAVGGKIILPDGTLQEAGCIIWQDGSCLGYGRGDSPSAPAYMFKRDVDYCSAAFLLTRRDLFLEDGGFDEDYVPAYYEETDYCVRLWKKGKRVVYDPNVIVLHHEFASSVSVQSAINMAIMNQPTFVAKNEDWLRFQHRPSQQNILAARISERRGGRRILFIDDKVPHESLGPGFQENNRILSELSETGHVVTLYPLTLSQEDWASIYRDIPREVEVIVDLGLPRLEEFLNERSGYYDLIFIGSPDHVGALKPLLEKSQLDEKPRVVCDAQELSFLRSARQLRSMESVSTDRAKETLVCEEIGLTVTAAESSVLWRDGKRNDP